MKSKQVQLQTADILRVLKQYQSKIEEKIHESIERLGPKNKLRDACEYALTNGGKRFRPALVLMVAESLGNQADVMEAALAVEFFHTASLIADDLPCMDDDDERREKPALHVKYDEATALLVSYGLIAAGYECIASNAEQLKQSHAPFANQSDRICLLALQNSTFNTGLLGATGGQFLDISPPNLKLDTLLDVIHKKTVSLFEISFVLGWLFGGGSHDKLDLVKKAASHFGLAFQIADDIGDCEQDIQNERQVNLANCLGKQKALSMFHEELNSFYNTLNILGLKSPELEQIGSLLKQQLSGSGHS